MTSETLWELQALPKKLLVLGGGPIGCEMTQAFSRLGSQVTVVDRNTRLMKREDDDVSEHIHQVFNSEGIDVRLQAQIESISGNTAYIRQGEGITEIAFDGILLALGRKARVSGFGLEALGVELDQGHTIAANAFLQTNIPNIFVCGDAVAPFQFTHTAAHQAWYACVNALFTPFKTFKVDYSVIPWATFTDPEVARVGLNEREAKAQNIAHEVTIYPLSELDRAITEQSNTGFIKVLTAGRSDKILGVSFVGEHAGDLIAEFVFAMKHNLGLSKVLATIHIYPTWAEANKFAAGEWRKKHVPAFALTALSIFHRWRRS
jgi:pyruvate/2-oxoglutarate dehydrogenase complex dihydrolipoamide dehydrogenase (E3) component